MRRGWLAVALLVSLGLNLGLALALLLPRRAAGELPLARAGERLAERIGPRAGERGPFLASQRRLVGRLGEQRGELERWRGAIRAELAAETPSPARLDELLAELGRAQAAFDRALVDGVLEARATLSGPARERYLRFLERHGGAGPGRGPGPFGRRWPGRHGRPDAAPAPAPEPAPAPAP